MNTFNEPAEIEFVMLANHVEAVNGLLYISGGGWSDHIRQLRTEGPPVSHFGVGVSLRVPWNETNYPHRLAFRVENDDSSVIVAQFETGITVGRPPNLDQGAIQHAVIGVTVDTIFPRAGGYRVVVELNEGADRKTWPFRVRDIPPVGTVSGPTSGPLTH